MNGSYFLRALACVLATGFIIHSSRAQSGYAVTERGPDYKVLQKTTVENGTNHVHRYTELATGMNYTNASGQLVETQEKVTILSTGGAVANQGRHQVYFPANIYNGVLQVVTPDGRHLQCRPLGVSYDDGSNTVFIATLTNAVGYLTSSNQVTYRNCFAGIKADLVCTYRRGGFECDLVFRAQPPTPDQFGLDADWTTLQLVTEFFNTQDPQQIPATSDEWFGLQDSTLKFGKLTMRQGKAFATKSTSSQPLSANSSTPVYKRWLHLDNRKFLIEELPLVYLADELDGLPLTASAAKPAATIKMASSRPAIPPSHGITACTNQILLAKNEFKSEPGVVLDYNAVDADQEGDLTFETDNTYLISADVNCWGNVIIENGAVIKYANDSRLNAFGVTCPTANPERPAIFTTVSDDRFGEHIEGTDGDNVCLCLFSWASLSNLRFYNPGLALFAHSADVRDCEFHGGQGLMIADSGSVGVSLHNVLFSDVSLAVELGLSSDEESASLVCENVTVDNCGYFSGLEGSSSYDASADLRNCLFTSTGGIPDASDNYYGSYTAVTTNAVVILPDADGVFQTGANAGYYLASDSPYRNVGTTDIDSDLLAELQTMTTYAPQDGGMPDTNGTDLGYHYSVNEDSDHDGLPDWWEWKYFHSFAYNGTNLDAFGNSLLSDYQNSTDPNIIQFVFTVPSQYVSTNIVSGSISILDGVPVNIAVLVDSTNIASVTWTAYTSSNITVNLGFDQGAHDVWVGLRGFPADAQQTWQGTTLVLDTNLPAISITSPTNNVSFNASRVNVSGSFTAPSIRGITVNNMTAFIHGTNYEAVNVPLDAGTNAIVAVVESWTGSTNAATINVVAVTNADGSLNDPVQLTATPVAGFDPLSADFQAQSTAPGTLVQAFYDFNGDSLADLANTDLSPVTYTYTNSGEYFPIVTLQTSVARFSSVGGWNAYDPNAIRINVQPGLEIVMSIPISNPVDIKWAGTNLYVLSGSTATITEFDSKTNIIRTLANVGSDPSGLDVDAAGNVYVALTGNNKVCKFNPTAGSFAADPGFGTGGSIGLADGTAGTDPGAFNAPYDVAVSADGGTISVSDSGNNRIQQFSAATGAFEVAFDGNGSGAGQFNTPKGLTYDSLGTLYVVDSGNNRIVVSESPGVLVISGSGGTALGQFNGPMNLSVNERGVYVADTGNNRIQKFDAPEDGLFTITPANVRFGFSTNFSQPYSVAAVDNLTNELFYVADTGNNRVVLCRAPNNDANDIMAVWNRMIGCVNTGDFKGAATCFSVVSADNYLPAFLCLGRDTIADVNQIGSLTPVFIRDHAAKFYFQQTIAGHLLLFPVEFSKEFGGWKILEF